MLVNLVSLNLEANTDVVTFYPVNDKMKREAIEDDNNKFGQAFPRHLCLTTKEAKFARGCLLGEAAFYPFFDDGIHHIKFIPNGIVESYVYTGSKTETFYFTFPGKELIPYLDAVVGLAKDIPQANSDKVKLTIPKSEIRKWRDELAPCLEWDYCESGHLDIRVESKLRQDASDERATRLQDCLDGLKQIALNYSDGIPSVIHIRFDSVPVEEIPSHYYWWITFGKEQQQIMNGGIIAHKNADSDMWRYSTHT